MNVQFIAVCLPLLFASCTGCTAKQPSPLKASFRLTNQATAVPLTNVVVSVYDGFDKTMRSIPGAQNESYHFADIRTSTQGTLDLDLSQFKEAEVLIKAGPLYKYIWHRTNLVKVTHYIPEGNSLRVSAHYNYELKAKRVTVIRFPEKRPEQSKEFSIIDVPMDQ